MVTASSMLESMSSVPIEGFYDVSSTTKVLCSMLITKKSRKAADGQSLAAVMGTCKPALVDSAGECIISLGVTHLVSW